MNSSADRQKRFDASVSIDARYSPTRLRYYEPQHICVVFRDFDFVAHGSGVCIQQVTALWVFALSWLNKKVEGYCNPHVWDLGTRQEGERLVWSTTQIIFGDWTSRLEWLTLLLYIRHVPGLKRVCPPSIRWGVSFFPSVPPDNCRGSASDYATIPFFDLLTACLSKQQISND